MQSRVRGRLPDLPQPKLRQSRWSALAGVSVAKDRFTPKSQRIKRDPVTGVREVTVLDPVQLAYERILRAMDTELAKLSNVEGENLMNRVAEAVVFKLPHTDGPEGVKRVDRQSYQAEGEPD
jgi:hypothetical protein